MFPLSVRALWGGGWDTGREGLESTRRLQPPCLQPCGRGQPWPAGSRLTGPVIPVRSEKVCVSLFTEVKTRQGESNFVMFYCTPYKAFLSFKTFSVAGSPCSW